MGGRDQQVLEYYHRLKGEAEAGGYSLHPDEEFVLDLIEGLMSNERRYGYPSCPCRMAAGEKGADVDIICPCDYRNPDLDDYSQCYCALYVSGEKATGEKPAESIPERRPSTTSEEGWEAPSDAAKPSLPVWRCTVCGYLSGREAPPGICPICKAKREKFERFM
jgi:ferredoxin-thioredoxin reductase catalytic chain